MKKSLYIVLLSVCMSQQAVAQESGNGFLDKVKNVFSTDTRIGTYTFKDGAVYTATPTKAST